MVDYSYTLDRYRYTPEAKWYAIENEIIKALAGSKNTHKFNTGRMYDNWPKQYVYIHSIASNDFAKLIDETCDYILQSRTAVSDPSGEIPVSDFALDMLQYLDVASKQSDFSLWLYTVEYDAPTQYAYFNSYKEAYEFAKEQYELAVNGGEKRYTRNKRAIRARADVVEWNTQIIKDKLYFMPLVMTKQHDKDSEMYTIFSVYTKPSHSALYFYVNYVSQSSTIIRDFTNIKGYESPINREISLPTTRELKDGDVARVITSIVRSVQAFLGNSVEPDTDDAKIFIEYIVDAFNNAFTGNMAKVLDTLNAFLKGIPPTITPKFFTRTDKYPTVHELAENLQQLGYMLGNEHHREWFTIPAAVTNINFERLSGSLYALREGDRDDRLSLNDKIKRIKDIEKIVKKVYDTLLDQFNEGNIEYSNPKSLKRLPLWDELAYDNAEDDPDYEDFDLSFDELSGIDVNFATLVRHDYYNYGTLAELLSWVIQACAKREYLTVKKHTLQVMDKYMTNADKLDGIFLDTVYETVDKIAAILIQTDSIYELVMSTDKKLAISQREIQTMLNNIKRSIEGLDKWIDNEYNAPPYKTVKDEVKSLIVPNVRSVQYLTSELNDYAKILEKMPNDLWRV